MKNEKQPYRIIAKYLYLSGNKTLSQLKPQKSIWNHRNQQNILEPKLTILNHLNQRQPSTVYNRNQPSLIRPTTFYSAETELESIILNILELKSIIFFTYLIPLKIIEPPETNYTLV